MSESMAGKIEALVTEFTTGLEGIDYSLLLDPIVAVFPTVFTVMLALAGIKKAIGFVKSILGV